MFGKDVTMTTDAHIIQKYRVTHVVRTDYGDGPAAGSSAVAHLSRMDCGNHSQDVPATLTQRVPIGTKPGGVIQISIGRVS